jgi:hypothetical protein
MHLPAGYFVDAMIRNKKRPQAAALGDYYAM